HADASWADDQATQRSSQGYTFSLSSGSVSWRSTRSSSVLSSSCEAEIYAGAMAAQELRWPTYLLTDLGEQPRSPPVLYVYNKAMLALCREHRLEHRTKHIALRYFLARELQQRGQLRLAYVASQANTADIFTKALAPGDHQRFCTLLDCVVFLLVPNILLVHPFLFLHNNTPLNANDDTLAYFDAREVDCDVEDTADEDTDPAMATDRSRWEPHEVVHLAWIRHDYDAQYRDQTRLQGQNREVMLLEKLRERHPEFRHNLAAVKAKVFRMEAQYRRR
ncbi:unnamed protein product, partial [Closterium sp. NIES-54]